MYNVYIVRVSKQIEMHWREAYVQEWIALMGYDRATFVEHLDHVGPSSDDKNLKAKMLLAWWHNTYEKASKRHNNRGRSKRCQKQDQQHSDG